MYLKNVDGKPIFAKHLVKIDKQDIENLKSNKDSRGLSIEQNGDIVCYSLEESDKTVEVLERLNINFKLFELNDQLADELDDIKYHNRSEVIEYLQKNKIPKVKEELDMMDRVKELERKVEILMKHYEDRDSSKSLPLRL